MTRVAAAVLVVCAAAAAAVVLNLLLLDHASGNSDQLGRLQPLATVPTTPAPRGTVRRPGRSDEQERGSDD
jgi:hypothetical protein